MKSSLLVLFAITILASCANKDGNSSRARHEQNPKVVTADLSSKSLDEVLDLKYNNAELKCELWTQQNEKLDISATPNATARLDLKTKPALPSKVSLHANIENHSIDTELTVTAIDLYSSLRYTDIDGIFYHLKFTPQVKLDVAIKTVTWKGQNISSKTFSIESRSVNEKIMDKALNASTRINAGPIHDYIQCYIDTDIKPEYQDQFRIELPKP